MCLQYTLNGFIYYADKDKSKSAQYISWKVSCGYAAMVEYVVSISSHRISSSFQVCRTIILTI